jgi:RND family efflux transporter MFP subunit
MPADPIRDPNAGNRHVRFDIFVPPEHRDQQPQPGADRPSQTSCSLGARRRLIIFVSAVALALGGGFLLVHHQKTASQAQLADTTKREVSELPRVDVVTVGPPSSAQTLVLPGETAAWHTATIYARVNGYIEHWFNDIGDHVRKGQVLATIDTPDLDAEFDSAKAKLKLSESQVLVRQAQLEFATTTYERWRDSPVGIVSDQERQDKKARYSEAVAELQVARSQVGLDQALVDRMAAFEGFKRVRAPFDGTIIERRVDLGSLVSAGSTTNTTVLYRMTLDDPLRVFIDAPQSTAAQLMRVGTPGAITCDYRPNERFKGAVTRTAEAINPEVRTLRVEVDIPNPNHALVPGTSVNVTFDSGLIEIPAAALLFRTKGPQVAVIKDIVDDHGVMDIRDVTIARNNGNVVEISAGLENGDRVALNPSSQIVNGERVEIHDGRKARSALEIALTGLQELDSFVKRAILSNPDGLNNTEPTAAPAAAPIN